MKSLREAMGPMLAQVAQKTGTGSTLSPVWAAVVGEVLAKHSRPVGWAGGVVTIECDGPAWQLALESERALLLTKLRDQLGTESALHSLVITTP